MTVFLIANIGNRDVWVDKAAPISGELNPAWNNDASRRALGRALLQDWAACRSHLKLPILGKAVAYVREQAGALDRVVLVSSDQSGQENVAAHHLAQDTCELAPVVERLLAEQYDVPAEAVTHWTVSGNPADYAGMQHFFRRHLPPLQAQAPGATFYLEVSGGTPAMTSMLLAVGAEVLALAARPLYVSEHEQEPFPLDLGRRMVAESLLEVVRRDLEIYAYHAAAQTIEENRELLGAFVAANNLESLLVVLRHARLRRNFDFEAAEQVLVQVSKSSWLPRLHEIAVETHAPTREMLLSEVIWSAHLDYENLQLLDFIVHVFQFVEGVWRYLALQLGVEFEHNGRPNPDGKELAPAWKAEHTALIEELESQGVRLHQVNRYVLEQLVTTMCNDEDIPLELLRKLETIGDLRNRAVHQYHYLTLELLRDTFFPKKRDRKRHPPEDAAKILHAMAQVWSEIANRSFDFANPYLVINDLCREIIKASIS